MKKKGWRFNKIKDAICFWEMRENIENMKKQFYNYGYWDGVSYRKYKILPKKHLAAAVYPILLFPVFFIQWILSHFTLVNKIKFFKRKQYFIGFRRGLLG